MRMKKYLILALTAAIAAVGCSKTFEVVPTPTDTNPIGFGTWANVLTKATHATGSGNTAFTNGEAFDVYGYKTLAADQVVFDGDDVTYASTSQTWSYTNKRFWDPSASQYVFFAVLPAGNLAAEAHAGDYAKTGLFTSNDITFDDPTSYTNDILVADKKTVTPTGSAGSYVYSGDVQMQFNHAASRVDFKVKQDNALGDATVTVTDLALINISNKGHVTVSNYTTNAPSPTITWTPAASPTTLGAEGVYSIISSGSVSVPATAKTIYDTDADPDADNDVTASAATLFSDYVFMPQTISDDTQKLRISYTIQIGSEAANVYTNKEFDLLDFMTADSNNNSAGSAIAAWAPGTHYTYYLTIGANAITFTASVKAWTTTTDGYQYLLK